MRPGIPGPKTQTWTDPTEPSNPTANLARRCLQLALVLCLVGLVPGLLAIWGERRAAAASAWRDPADDIRPAAIAPDIALLSLAGVPDDQVLALAMETGELETTRALLVFSAALTDQQRMNGWLWLAYQYQKVEQKQRAAQAYRLAGTGAILNDHLPDLLRTETLLAVGRQLIALHDAPSARFYLQQAALIGAYAPHLTNHHRHSLLKRLIPALLRADGRRDDWTVLAKAVESGTGRGGNSPSPWRNASTEGDAALVKARDDRRAAAAALLAALTLSPVEPSAGYDETDTDQPAQDQARQALRQALLAEEAAIDDYLAHSLASAGSARETALAAQETRLRWLLLQRRIAAGGAGDGLVPEWETSREQIRAALATAWTDWLTLYIEPEQVVRAPHRALAAAYWGLYPDAPVADLVSAIQSTISPGRLRLTILKPGTPPVVGWSE